MKAFFWLIIGLFILSLILMLGNSLNCNSRRGVTVCPELCNSSPVKCDPDLEDLENCQEQLNCHAPSLDQYPQIIQSHLEPLRPIN